MNFAKKMNLLESYAEGLYVESYTQVVEKIKKFIENSDDFKEEYIKHNQTFLNKDLTFEDYIMNFIEGYRTLWLRKKQ